MYKFKYSLIYFKRLKFDFWQELKVAYEGAKKNKRRKGGCENQERALFMR
jgi:hypothetical protein